MGYFLMGRPHRAWVGAIWIGEVGLGIGSGLVWVVFGGDGEEVIGGVSVVYLVYQPAFKCAQHPKAGPNTQLLRSPIK